MRRDSFAVITATLLTIGLAAHPTAGDVKLPAVFGDHMVLQRGAAVPVWGWAEASEKVTVTLCDQSKSATADNDGKWSVKLGAVEAGGPYTLKVEGNNKLELSDVLVGEVWLCSGQSNMAMSVRG
ncbi:MAG: sialate O-acetylesterase, partial [Phycisphaerae bacterium]